MRKSLLNWYWNLNIFCSNLNVIKVLVFCAVLSCWLTVHKMLDRNFCPWKKSYKKLFFLNYCRKRKKGLKKNNSLSSVFFYKIKIAYYNFDAINCTIAILSNNLWRPCNKVNVLMKNNFVCFHFMKKKVSLDIWKRIVYELERFWNVSFWYLLISQPRKLTGKWEKNVSNEME